MRAPRSFLVGAFTSVLVNLLGGCFDDVTAPPAIPDAAPADAGPLPDAIPLAEGVATLAGSNEAAAVDGNRVVARFSNPVNVEYGPDGNLYVADFDNSLLRVVDMQGNVTTLVDQAEFRRPFGITFGPDGTLYVQTDDSDMGQHDFDSGTIWKVDRTSGEATVIVRNVGRPRGIAALPDGRILLSDGFHHVIRILNPATGDITPLAGMWDAPGYLEGTGSAARFNMPYGIAVRADGKIVVADYGNNVLRLVSVTGETVLLAGNGTEGFVNGGRFESQFSQPQDIAIDAEGNTWVADNGNYAVRLLDFESEDVTTYAGSGSGGYRDHVDLLQAQFFGLEGISISDDGATLFIADGNRGESGPFNRVRRITMDGLGQ